LKAVYAVCGFVEAALEILITDFTHRATFCSNQSPTSYGPYLVPDILMFLHYGLIKTLCIHRIDLRHTKQKPRVPEQKQHWNKIISEERLKELLKND